MLTENTGWIMLEQQAFKKKPAVISGEKRSI
jgi:hypothetical protein